MKVIFVQVVRTSDCVRRTATDLISLYQPISQRVQKRLSMESDKAIRVGRLLAAVITLWLSICGPQSRADELGEAVQAAVQRVDPFVVRLRPVGSAGSADGVRPNAPTTGLVISTAGEILTSAFALQGNPQTVLVETQSGQRFPAEIVATDHVRQLVLLRTKDGQWQAPAVPSRNDIQTGQWAIAVGRFYSAASSNISVGIISAHHRIHGMALQTDARISPMNYGGPLTDLQGQVQGILVPLSPTAGPDANAGVEWYDSGIGFAIPLEDALVCAEKLRSGKNREPGRMGIAVKSAGRFHPEVVVSKVHRGGPGSKAGLLPGDRIMTVNGTTIDRAAILETAVARSYAGDSLTLEVLRNNTTVPVTIELTDTLPPLQRGYLGLLPLARRPAVAAAQPAPAATEEPAQEQPQSAGIDVITMQHGPARSAGAPPQLTLLSVDATPVSSAAQLARMAADLEHGQKVELAYRVTANPEQKTISVTTADLPQSIDQVSEQDLAGYLHDGGPAPEQASAPRREDLEIGPAGNCVLLFPGTALRQRQPGLVVLLSTTGQPEETILRRWKSVLNSHDLAIAIPANPEKTRLTDEDLPLIGTAIARLVVEYSVDRGRICVVAESGESALAASLLLNDRSPVRGAAMETGWLRLPPGTTGDQERPGSVLILDSGRDRQTRALTQQAVDGLKGAGLQVYLSGDNETAETPAEDASVRQIADWTLLLKSF